MRSLRAFLFLVSVLPACADATPVTSATETAGDASTGAEQDTDPTTGGSEQPDDVALVCDLMRAACSRQVACGHAVVNNNPGDVDACVAQQQCESASDLLDLPHVALDPDAVQACIAALEAASCGELAAQGLEIDAACQHYIAGTLGEGEACHGGAISDCAPGLSCVFADGTCPGICQAPAAACTEGSCGPDAFCGSDDVCHPRAALGEACDSALVGFSNLTDEPCAAGAHCEGSVCVADLAAGAACWGQSVHACGPDAACVCADPDVCEGDADYSCGTPRAVGEACNMAFDCADGLYCDFGQGGLCAPRGGLGAACDDSFGACLHSLTCVDGACADDEPVVSEIALLAAGERCVDGGSCPLGSTCTCDDGSCADMHCAVAPGLGESCEAQLKADFTPFACAEGLCDVLAGNTCVLPAGVGEPCPIDGITLACASLVCIGGACASPEETLCHE